MKKKIVVVGGGITGIVTAALLAKEGNIVELYEADECIGGVLRDVRIGDKWYYRGCQYLKHDAWWQYELGIRENLYTFPNVFGSFTKLGLPGQKVLRDDYAQPVVYGRHTFPRLKAVPVEAREYLAGYGDLATGFLKWGASFNIEEGLHSSNLGYMQINRIYLPDMHDELAAMKASSDVLDEMFGIPHALRLPDAGQIFASLPPRGYDVWLREITAIAAKIGVICHTKSPVTPYRNSLGMVDFRVRKRKLDPDLVVWCGNPTALIYAFSGYRLQASPVKTTILVGKIDGVADLCPTYWQIFDLEKRLFRLFIWRDGEDTNFTAESIRAMPQEIEADIISFLDENVEGASIVSRGHFDELRWVNTTVSDHSTIVELQNMMVDGGVVPGAWETYGRDEKIERIASTLLEIGYL